MSADISSLLGLDYACQVSMVCVSYLQIKFDLDLLQPAKIVEAIVDAGFDASVTDTQEPPTKAS